MAVSKCAVKNCAQTPTESVQAKVGDSVKDVPICSEHYKRLQTKIKPGDYSVEHHVVGHQCPTIQHAIRQGRVPTTAEMDEMCDGCRGLQVLCLSCGQWHHFIGSLDDQVCACGNTKFDTRSLVSERTWNPNRKVGK